MSSTNQLNQKIEKVTFNFYTPMETKAITLTELETKVVKAISNADEFEGMPTDCIENISLNTGISTKVLRGVLSSLLQKNILMEGEYPNGMTAFHLR